MAKKEKMFAKSKKTDRTTGKRVAITYRKIKAGVHVLSTTCFLLPNRHSYIIICFPKYTRVRVKKVLLKVGNLVSFFVTLSFKINNLQNN